MLVNMKKYEVILLTFALFGELIFWGFYVLTGRVYGGAGVDNSFSSFMMLVDIIPLAFFIKYLMSAKSKKNVGLVIAVLLLILAILLFEADFSFSFTLVKSWVAYSIPGALIGILLAKYDAGDYFAKWLEPIMLFLTAEGIRSMSLILAVSYTEVNEYGIGVQSLSYYCAFAFAINLYFLLFGNELKDRFKYAQTSIYKAISVVLLVVQIVVSLSSGGRGGFVLAVISAAVLVYKKFTKRGSNVLSTSLMFAMMIAALLVIVSLLPENISDAVSTGSKRTFSYITNEGIDMSQTSNRDDVYGDAWIDIQKKPILGYGLLMKGSFIEKSWPHNIFLEVLLQGGVVYMIFFLIVMISLYKKLRLMLKRGHSLFIVTIALYPGVMLLFSGSYIATELFWFVVSYIYCYDVKRIPTPVNQYSQEINLQSR